MFKYRTVPNALERSTQSFSYRVFLDSFLINRSSINAETFSKIIVENACMVPHKKVSRENLNFLPTSREVKFPYNRKKAIFTNTMRI